MKSNIVTALNRIIAAKGWRMMTDEEIELEYQYEYSKVEPIFGDIFPDVEDFVEAVKAGKPKTITPAIDNRISYRSRTDSLEDLKDLVSGYQFPRDVDRIVDGLEKGTPLPYPIILKYNNSMRIMSGNTRMDAAFILGKNPTALIVDISEQLKRVEEYE